MQSHRIFLADDDHDDWYIIEDSMKEIGFQDRIRFFADGSDLIDTLNSIPVKEDLPDLIVLDLNMPKTNGTEILHEIKSYDRLEHIPVIIYSTSINALEKEKCIGLGAYDYVTKPVSAKDSLTVAKLFSSFIKL